MIDELYLQIALPISFVLLACHPNIASSLVALGVLAAMVVTAHLKRLEQKDVSDEQFRKMRDELDWVKDRVKEVADKTIAISNSVSFSKR